MRISDWSSDVCSSDLFIGRRQLAIAIGADGEDELFAPRQLCETLVGHRVGAVLLRLPRGEAQIILALVLIAHAAAVEDRQRDARVVLLRQSSEEHRFGKGWASPGRSRLTP